jgi:hypothetical protein
MAIKVNVLQETNTELYLHIIKLIFWKEKNV